MILPGTWCARVLVRALGAGPIFRTIRKKYNFIPMFKNKSFLKIKKVFYLNILERKQSVRNWIFGGLLFLASFPHRFWCFLINLEKRAKKMVSWILVAFYWPIVLFLQKDDTFKGICIQGHSRDFSRSVGGGANILDNLKKVKFYSNV